MALPSGTPTRGQAPKMPAESPQTPVPVTSPSVANNKPVTGRKQVKKFKAAKLEARLQTAAPQVSGNASVQLVTSVGSAPTPTPVLAIPPAQDGALLAEPGLQAASAPNLSAELKRMENNLLTGLSAKMERLFQQKSEKEKQERDKAERERNQRLLLAIAQAATTGVSALPQQIEKIVQKELQATLTPALGRFTMCLEKTLVKNLDELQARLESKQENLPPRLASEVAAHLPTANDIASSLQSTMQNALEASFRRSFHDAIIPSFQSSCQSMFQQIYGAILPGLQHTLEEAIEPGMRQLSTEVPSQLQTLTNMVNELRSNTERYQSTRPPMALQPPGFIEHQVTEDQLLQLLRRESYEQAFACALSERGTDAVRLLLKWIEPQGFFKSDQHLSQAVLGSLIHRVALDLEHDPSTKLEWLSHLLLQFRPRDPSIASHSQHILHHTTHHLNALLSNYPHHPLSTNIRLLLHMANSLV